VRRFVAVGGHLAAGSESGAPLIAPGAGLHQELSLLVAAGLPPARALLAVTRDGARLIGVDSIGVLRAGAVADFLVLDADPLADIGNARRINRVVRGGTSWTPAELRSRW
jgi:imidazolonepropionase-like amidohydrolase